MKNRFKNTEVTLYIPCYNPDMDLLETVVESVLRQSMPPENIVVLDDASPEPLKSEWKEVDILRCEENLGLAASRNLLVEQCETPLLAGIDADVVLETDWLEKMLEAMNGNDVVGVGGSLKEFYQDSLGDRWRAVHMAQHWGDEPLLNPRFLYGANTLFKKDILKEVSYISTLKTNYEDMSLSEKLYEAGYNLYYQSSARCWHYRRDSAESILPGFWKWFHAKGHLNDEFKTPQALMKRIDAVNFGIFRYRYDQDVEAGRDELLILDSLIPWVFCAYDLTFANQVAGLKIPIDLWKKAEDGLSKEQLKLFQKIAPNTNDETTGNDIWHDEYMNTFNACLSKWNWE